MFVKLKKIFLFYYMKAVRDKGTPEYIARGWAIGMFVGFAVPFGLQLAISIPLSFLLKGSKLGAVLGTFTTNHFTIFIIYPVQCWVGNRILCGNLSLTALFSLFTRQVAALRRGDLEEAQTLMAQISPAYTAAVAAIRGDGHGMG